MGSFGVGGIYPEKGSITWKAAWCWIRIGKKPKRPLRVRLDDRENKPALKSGFDKAWGIDHARITRRTGQIPGSARDAFLVGDAPGVVSYHRWRCACRTPGAYEISVG